MVCYMFLCYMLCYHTSVTHILQDEMAILTMHVKPDAWSKASGNKSLPDDALSLDGVHGKSIHVSQNSFQANNIRKTSNENE